MFIPIRPPLDVNVIDGNPYYTNPEVIEITESVGKPKKAGIPGLWFVAGAGLLLYFLMRQK